ncbi:MAG: RNA polymerase sigma factor, partial [bacterium]
TCLNLLESRKRFKAQKIESTPAEELPYIESPEFDFVDEDLRERILAVIETLPVKYRTVLVLFHIQHLAYQEIVEIMQMPMSSVKTHLFRARAMLRERLLDKIPHEELAA